jgi:hypothetical protein
MKQSTRLRSGLKLLPQEAEAAPKHSCKFPNKKGTINFRLSTIELGSDRRLTKESTPHRSGRLEVQVNKSPMKIDEELVIINSPVIEVPQTSSGIT